MRKIFINIASFAAAFALASSALFASAASFADNGFTHMKTSNSPECYADVTIEGNHFTVDGRSVVDPVRGVKFSVNAVEVTNYEFTKGDDYTFHAEFDAQLEIGWCNFWLVGESNKAMSYRIQHDENGWRFPDNGLAQANAEKLNNILTAAPAASAYYLSQTADPDEIEWTLAELERIVQEVCGDEQDDYRKAYLLFQWETENIYYDHNAAETEVTLDTVAVHNVLDRRRTTCAGYSNTYSALLETAGIRSVNLKGAAVAGEVSYEELLTAGENHEFSAFWYEAENRWAYVDTTWGGNGDYRDGEYTKSYVPGEEYFDVSNEAFAINHRIDKAEERNYTGALEAMEEAGEDISSVTTPEPTSTTEPEITTTTTDEQQQTTAATAAPADDGNTVRSIAVYILIGSVGLIIVVIGIILAMRKK